MQGKKSLVLLLATTASGLVLAACSAGGSPRGSTGATLAGGTQPSHTPDASTVSIVRCYRSHGDPGFPDPVYDPGDGRWHFAVSPDTAPEGTRQACQHLFPTANASPPASTAQLQALVRLARCLRQQGVPNWPDPQSDGSFALPPALQVKTPAYARASVSCRAYFPSSGLNVHAAS